jgi:hypothetical protein
VAAITGCMASFTALPPEVPAPASNGALPLKLETGDSAKLQVGVDDWINWPAGDYASEATESLYRRGWAARVDPATSEPTIRGSLAVDTFQGMINPGLATLTAYVIPGVHEYRFELTLSVTTEDGERWTCRRSYTQRVWSQVLLLFAYPFRSPAHRRFQAANRLAADCLSELVESRAARRGSERR